MLNNTQRIHEAIGIIRAAMRIAHDSTTADTLQLAIHELQAVADSLAQGPRSVKVQVRDIGLPFQKIPAIKAVREFSGMGLRESKVAVEEGATFLVPADRIRDFAAAMGTAPMQVVTVP